jgi:hypothetical protein
VAFLFAISSVSDSAAGAVCRGIGQKDLSANWKDFDFNVRLKRILPMSSRCDVTGSRSCEFRIRIGVGHTSDEAWNKSNSWKVAINHSEYKKAYETKKSLMVNSTAVPNTTIYQNSWDQQKNVKIYFFVEEIDLYSNDMLVNSVYTLNQKDIFVNPTARPNCDDKWFVLTHSAEGRHDGNVEHAMFLFTIEAKRR